MIGVIIVMVAVSGSIGWRMGRGYGSPRVGRKYPGDSNVSSMRRGARVEKKATNNSLTYPTINKQKFPCGRQSN